MSAGKLGMALFDENMFRGVENAQKHAKTVENESKLPKMVKNGCCLLKQVLGTRKHVLGTQNTWFCSKMVV